MSLHAVQGGYVLCSDARPNPDKDEVAFEWDEVTCPECKAIGEARGVAEDITKAFGELLCRGCGTPLDPSCPFADGCACNSPRGVNHGIVPTWKCTCKECDPEETGGPRTRPVR